MNEEKKDKTKESVIENNDVNEQVDCNNSEPTADAIGPGVLGITTA
ncbi:hypothetical protein [Clostridium hydrogenum]|nr:hypothetical protein [Clostridium hydrogenum]